MAGGGPVYLSASIPFAHRYVAFYSPSNGGREVRYFSAAPAGAPVGARAVCSAVRDPGCEGLRRDAAWKKVASVRELSGDESFLIFERQ